MQFSQVTALWYETALDGLDLRSCSNIRSCYRDIVMKYLMLGCFEIYIRKHVESFEGLRN